MSPIYFYSSLICTRGAFLSTLFTGSLYSPVLWANLTIVAESPWSWRRSFHPEALRNRGFALCSTHLLSPFGINHRLFSRTTPDLPFWVTGCMKSILEPYYSCLVSCLLSVLGISVPHQRWSDLIRHTELFTSGGAWVLWLQGRYLENCSHRIDFLQMFKAMGKIQRNSENSGL